MRSSVFAAVFIPVLALSCRDPRDSGFLPAAGGSTNENASDRDATPETPSSESNGGQSPTPDDVSTVELELTIVVQNDQAEGVYLLDSGWQCLPVLLEAPGTTQLLNPVPAQYECAKNPCYDSIQGTLHWLGAGESKELKVTATVPVALRSITVTVGLGLSGDSIRCKEDECVGNGQVVAGPIVADQLCAGPSSGSITVPWDGESTEFEIPVSELTL